MTRILQPELLDELPSTDPRATHSRGDLRRINALMGNARAIIRFVKQYARRSGGGPAVTIAEIGAGDGYVSIRLARALSADGISGKLLLIDRQPSLRENVAGWNSEVIEADVFDWLSEARPVDVIIANLFLHHFNEKQLREMLSGCAALCNCLVAAEPRRTRIAAWFARRVRLVGCNEVTRHDAEISVRAGFAGVEISALWPQDGRWQLVERRTGLFTHFFGATQIA